MAQKLWQMMHVNSSMRKLPTSGIPLRFVLGLLLGAMATLTGCSSEEDIRAYTVPKSGEAQARSGGQSPGAGQGVDSRMLAAIVPQADQSWFFKLVGRDATVSALQEPFLELIRSIRIDEGAAAPTWDLPEGWVQQPAAGMRYATILPLPDEPTVELTVIPLPTAGQDETEYLLSNVNRWRDQLGKPPIDTAELEAALKTENPEPTADIMTVPLGESLEAVVVNIAGVSSPSPGMGRGPFAPGASPQGPAVGPSRPTAPMASSLKYDVPDGWEEEPAGGMRKASFKVTHDDQTAEVTVIDLPESGLAPNVNRWREQISLPPLSPGEIEERAEAIEIDGNPAHYVELWADESDNAAGTILAAIVNVQGKSWFIKLSGPTGVAKAQRDAFRAFCESIRF